jgi:large subunit ribosomal protein L14
MKALKCNITRGLPLMARAITCDNSGAKIVKIIAVKGYKSTMGRLSAAGIGDMVFVSIVKGKLEMRKEVFPAVVVRQRKEYKRPDGTRIKFEDNAVVILKDEKGNPKGTIFKGPIAKEVTQRWPAISKVAKLVV